MIELKVSIGEGVAYVYLPDHPRNNSQNVTESQTAAAPGWKETVRLLDLMPYNGIDIYLDFDDRKRLIGIEILG